MTNRNDDASTVGGRSSSSSLFGGRRSFSKLKRKRGPATTEKYIESSSGDKGKKGVPTKTFKKLKRFLGGRVRRERKKKYNVSTTASLNNGEDDEDAVSLNSSFNSVKTSDGLSLPTQPTRSPTFNLAPILNPSDNDRTNEDDFLFENELFPGSVSFLSLNDSLVTKARPKKVFKIVLLLVDPETRRFELLHLEFESGQVHINDVITQVTESVTEEALRKKVYTGLSGCDAIQRTGNDRLSTFCKENDVLVAIPEKSTAKEVIQLAIPILTDNKIQEMFLESCIDATSWKELEVTSVSRTDPVVPIASQALSAPPAPPDSPAPPASSTRPTLSDLSRKPENKSMESPKTQETPRSPADKYKKKSTSTTRSPRISAEKKKKKHINIPLCTKDSPTKSKKKSIKPPEEVKLSKQKTKPLCRTLCKESVIEINLSADVLASFALALLVGFALLSRFSIVSEFFPFRFWSGCGYIEGFLAGFQEKLSFLYGFHQKLLVSNS